MESPGKSGKKALAIFGKLEYNRCRKEGKEIKNMKVQNIKDVNKFFEVVDNCAGKVELVTGEGDRLNLKSKLCQYVSLANIFSRSEEHTSESEVQALSVCVSCKYFLQR